MNAAMIADNHALQRDNKQLNALIKEYEQTLETVMSAFPESCCTRLQFHLLSRGVLNPIAQISMREYKSTTGQ